MSTIIEPTFILHDGKRTHAVISIEQWQHIEATLEAAADNQAADQAQTEPTLPLAQAKRLWSGTHPLRVWREHQNLTQQNLAIQTNLSQTTIAQIENGTRQGSLKTLTQLARTLGLSVDDLLP